MNKLILIISILLFSFLSNAQIIFQKTYGGIFSDFGNSVEQTTDSGFIICGAFLNITNSDFDSYLIKTDINGDTLWTKIFGTFGLWDEARSVKQTINGGYILCGVSVNLLHGNETYVIKTNSLGDTIWTRNYGGFADEWGSSVIPTTGGGFIIAGVSSSYGAGLMTHT